MSSVRHVTWRGEMRAYVRSVRHFERPVHSTLACLHGWAGRIVPRIRGARFVFAIADVEAAMKSYPVWDLSSLRNPKGGDAK